MCNLVRHQSVTKKSIAKLLRRINMRAKDALNDVNGMKKRHKNRENAAWMIDD